MDTDQYPPIPAGFHRWEPRPRGWKPGTEVKYAFRNSLLAFPEWQEMPGTAIPLGTPECDYLEAVRDEPGPTVEDHANDCRKAIKAMVEAEAAAKVSRVEPGKPPAERPTPRTDAFFWYQREQRDALKFARDLERELAEAADARKALEDAADLLNGRLRQEDQRKQRILALLNRARDHSAGMDMVAYAAIQDAINELTPR